MESEYKLVIGFLGWNYKLTLDGLSKFVRENYDQVYSRTRNSVILNDGTKIIAIGAEIRGYRFDQVILCDDERWDIYNKRFDDICSLKKYSLIKSCVPEECQIIEFPLF